MTWSARPVSPKPTRKRSEPPLSMKVSTTRLDGALLPGGRIGGDGFGIFAGCRRKRRAAFIVCGKIDVVAQRFGPIRRHVVVKLHLGQVEALIHRAVHDGVRRWQLPDF